MNWEFQILDYFQTLRTPLLDKIVPVVSSLVDNGYIWIALALVLLLIPKTRQVGAYMAFALLCNVILCNAIVKPIAHRIRPYDVKEGIDLLVDRLHDYSFPSGHTSASFASVMALYLAERKYMWKAAAVFSVVIGLTRLYLYVHYPTDVLGGMLLGLFCGWAGVRIYQKVMPVIQKRIQERRERKENNS